MLFRREVLDGILAGRINRVFARVGGTQRTVIGVLEFTSVEAIDDDELSAADAVGAGFRGFAGEDPRVALREQAQLDDAGGAAITARLARLDAASTRGPWTGVTLR